jgi:hypothetical protein
MPAATETVRRRVFSFTCFLNGFGGIRGFGCFECHLLLAASLSVPNSNAAEPT